MFKPTRLSFTLAALMASAVVHADIDVPLGSTQRVTQLFAYPNNCNVICFRPWTLEQTVEHYLNQSLQRDGYSRAKVSVSKRASGRAGLAPGGNAEEVGSALMGDSFTTSQGVAAAWAARSAARSAVVCATLSRM